MFKHRLQQPAKYTSAKHDFNYMYNNLRVISNCQLHVAGRLSAKTTYLKRKVTMRRLPRRQSRN